MRKFSISLILILALFFGAVYAADTPPQPIAHLRATTNQTALDRYVAKPDPNYAYKQVNVFEGKEATGFVLDMTSQSWRKPEEVDRTVWQHWVTIVVPKKVKSSTALMIIGGGSNKKDGDPPKGGDVNLHRIAVATRAIVAEVGTIPNEPLTFSDDQRRRSEDSIIAYTWDKYLRTGDEEWPLRLPMTKAVVRAMDTVQAFCATRDAGKHDVESFVVAGASKRGWTTWTTAAVDSRVIACVPIVIDLLNIVPSFEHHKAVLGDWAEAVDDYVNMGIMDWMGTPEYDALMKIVEPYSYLDRLTIPKLLMNGTGDQFFLPDSAQFYEKNIKGPFWFRYVPNAGHGLNASAYQSVQTFFHAAITNFAMPEMSWSYPDENTIRVETKTNPTAVKVWEAVNPDARDFRIDKLGAAYQATDLAPESDGAYVARVTKPEKGWKAFLVELTFPGPGDTPMWFTTPVHVTPDVLPFKYERANPLPQGFLSKQQ